MATAAEIANLINKNGGNLLDVIDIESIRTWCRLRNNLQQTNVTEDTDYQETYRKYFGIGGVGMNKQFIAKYFEIMEKHKVSEEPDIRQIALELLRDQARRKLSLTQFAAVTKMANLINQNYSIYDNHISEMFDFEKPTSAKMDNRERLNIYMRQHNQQMDTYRQLLDKKLIYQPLTVFKILLKKYHTEEFPEYNLPEMKKIDFLVSATQQTGYRLVT